MPNEDLVRAVPVETLTIDTLATRDATRPLYFPPNVVPEQSATIR